MERKLITDNRIAVILLNWNALQDTVECVESLLKSSYSNLIIYTVDNASHNNEANILEEKFPMVKVLPQKKNLGFCGGNNVGIKKAIEDGAEYILILNNDTLVPEDAVGKIIKEFLKMPDAGAVSPVILEYPAIDKIWFSKAAWDLSRAQFSLNPDNNTYEEIQGKNNWESEFACGCCLFTSAKILMEVGMLDERYFAYYDEADWCKRLENHGYKSYVTPKTIIYHKVSKSTPGLVSVYLMTRNRLLWMKENLSFSQRMKSFSYLSKEFVWHQCNSWGLVKGEYTKQHSRAFLRGRRDYKFGRFGRWGKKAEEIFYEKS